MQKHFLRLLVEEVTLKMISKKIAVSIIYVYYNTPQEILASVDSIKSAIGQAAYEVIIVDNASPKPLPQSLEKKGSIVKLRNSTNNGFGKAVNQAAKKAKGKFLLIVNPDTLFHPQAIIRMLDRIKKDSAIGALGPKIVDGKGNQLDSISMFPRLPKSFLVFSSFGKLWPFRNIVDSYNLRNLARDKEHIVNVLGGACILCRKSLYESIRGFDERFFMYFEEADLSYRIERKGFSLLYFPQSVVTHFVGRSSQDRESIQKIFERSRFLFFQKYHGSVAAFLIEGTLRFFRKENVLLFLIICLSTFFTLYRIDTLMMFFGDFGRDFLAAKEMVVHGKIPLVGITSSVTWLHQGPLSIYFIAFSFLVGKFNPSAPAVLYGLFGIVTSYFIYRIGRTFFSSTTGILAAAFFATSPLILVNIRIPYHTAPIPLFSAFFLFFLWKVFKEKKDFLLFGLSLGLMLLLELSNAVLFFALAVLYFFERPSLSHQNKGRILGGFLLGISPFLLYDLSHRFSQTFGFMLWVLNRIRLFFGLTISHAATTAHAPSAVATIWGQTRRLIYPQNDVVVFLAVGIILAVVLLHRFGRRKKTNLGFFICTTWILISLVGFTIHAAPGTAYFPLLFVPFSLLLAYCIEYIGQKWKPIYLLFLIAIVTNGAYTTINQYFLDTRSFSGSKAPGWNYGLGYALSEQLNVARFIVSDAKGSYFRLSGGGFLGKYASSIDNYHYLIWWLGGREREDTGKVYTLYQSKEEIPPGVRVYRKEFFMYITKDE